MGRAVRTIAASKHWARNQLPSLPDSGSPTSRQPPAPRGLIEESAASDTRDLFHLLSCRCLRGFSFIAGAVDVATLDEFARLYAGRFFCGRGADFRDCPTPIGVSFGVAFVGRLQVSLGQTPCHHGRVSGGRGFARVLGWFDFGHQVVDPAWRAGTVAGWSVFINAFHNTLRVTAAFRHLQPGSYCRGIPEAHWCRGREHGGRCSPSSHARGLRVAGPCAGGRASWRPPQ